MPKAAHTSGFFVILTLGHDLSPTMKEKPVPDLIGNGLSISEVFRKNLL
jgi:hypothetical protein